MRCWNGVLQFWSWTVLCTKKLLMYILFGIPRLTQMEDPWFDRCQIEFLTVIAIRSHGLWATLRPSFRRGPLEVRGNGGRFWRKKGGLKKIGHFNYERWIGWCAVFRLLYLSIKKWNAHRTKLPCTIECRITRISSPCTAYCWHESNHIDVKWHDASAISTATAQV